MVFDVGCAHVTLLQVVIVVGPVGFASLAT